MRKEWHLNKLWIVFVFLNVIKILSTKLLREFFSFATNKNKNSVITKKKQLGTPHKMVFEYERVRSSSIDCVKCTWISYTGNVVYDRLKLEIWYELNLKVLLHVGKLNKLSKQIQMMRRVLTSITKSVSFIDGKMYM